MKFRDEMTFKDGLAMGLAFFQLIFPFIIMVTGIMGIVTWMMF